MFFFVKKIPIFNKFCSKINNLAFSYLVQICWFYQENYFNLIAILFVTIRDKITAFNDIY